MEGDGHSQKNTPTFNISIHSLRMEGDRKLIQRNILISKFQSTPSAWRETATNGVFFANRNISIHSLRMEGDFSIY